MAELSNVLILLAHPNLSRSRANRTLAEAVRECEGIQIHDLYENYPDFFIDIKREQALLVSSDVVVLQFPIYWYSSPALLKEWQDAVLEYGFAYGEGGRRLQGKDLLIAVTTGGNEDSYGPSGVHRYPLADFLRPFERMAWLCHMNFLRPFVLSEAGRMPDEVLAAHAVRYRDLLTTFRDPAERAQARACLGSGCS